MASELENSIRSAAAKVAAYVADAAVMEVTTSYVVVGPTTTTENARPAAKTVIRLDGDCHATVPMREGPGGVLEVDSGLFEIHQANVATATEYRARVLGALIGLLQRR
ncbi:MAG TPA: hypothetical protein DEF43_07995 [Chloroflexus aurantiacus]|jgi:hypothetical protein|uniref:Uncharacterized protein n=1 Tax=Chloroflexus aurantiacus (strain ATCC 29366 / DSM 635 / J-10-fl) TaxID=324602 RepID=A9WHS0_CHLAA|nr:MULTISPECIES: hypothetical protein [Chloroflexus]ABY34188.1 hypothetical protein Caur_0956 [Chloroflexus aurantiacus J-10-fl]RMG50303.1 MAG: hypothetical protein D6716_08790 [Chloroflexota bacterium]GIV93537.1 MAG: hypothetical protein KatS3mg056_2246 [Chloroflexus sp.]HBW67091.1 hypothetical protein [Chloroflexus aurantiacus]